MSDKRKSGVRNSVLGADRAFRVLDGGKGANPGGPPPGGGAAAPDDDPCPVVALGDSGGTYYFLDPIGQKREFTARELGNRHNLVSLFRGDDAWLRRRFKVEKEFDDGKGGTVKRVVDFRVNDAARWAIGLASGRGLFGKRVQMRQPGIWRADDGMPIVHCGDVVLIDGEWKTAGERTGNQIWAAAEASPRPGTPCDYSVGLALQQNLQQYWRFKQPAGPIALLGLLVSGYLCGTLDWRLNAFVTGLSGSGKSALRRVIRNAWPMHGYSKDTTKPGIEQAIANAAMPVVLDEANDRNKSSGRDLIDMVLGASDDEGTQLTRGTADGKGRQSQIICSVIMFSIDAPELLPQHLNRFLLLELLKPESGADFRIEHAALAADIAKQASSLWGRAISSFERYQECLRLFRVTLRERNCDPREMDGKGALLAGWYVLTHEGIPGDRQLREGVAALGELVVSAERAELNDAPRRALRHLLACLATLHRSTDRDPIGVLLDRAWGEDSERSPASAWETLGNYGLRAIRQCDVPPDKRDLTVQCGCPQCFDRRFRKPVPRGGRGDGLWIANANPELTRIFNSTDFDAGRWRQQLLRLPSARQSRRSIRIGGSSGHAIWVSRDDLHVDLADDHGEETATDEM